MKEFCVLLCIKFFHQQDDIKIVKFDEGIFIIWPFSLRQCHFQDLPFYLKSTENVLLFGSPG